VPPSLISVTGQGKNRNQYALPDKRMAGKK